jgi:DNA polymerase III subunit chi
LPCEVWFYHLERTSLDQALPELLERTLARGWRALVRCPSQERLEHLDGWLWAYRDDGFLPHGAAGDAFDAKQPVLLTLGEENGNGAQALFLLDGVALPSLEGFERCLVLFDGRDDQALQTARARWREVKALGLPASYWRQSEDGRWRKQA